MEKILVVQGANMAYLGKRQPQLYGTTTATELDDMVREHARLRGVELEIFYTHVEGEAIGEIYAALDRGVQGLLMNPAGFMHAGFALRGCLRAIDIPYVEVHMTNTEKRGLRSVLSECSAGMVTGFGAHSYLLGMDALLRLIRCPQPT